MSIFSVSSFYKLQINFFQRDPRDEKREGYDYVKGGQEAYNAQFLFEKCDKGRCGKDLGIYCGKDHKKNRYESEEWGRVVKHADIRERDN